jgi:hypothetical protein
VVRGVGVYHTSEMGTAPSKAEQDLAQTTHDEPSRSSQDESHQSSQHIPVAAENPSVMKFLPQETDSPKEELSPPSPSPDEPALLTNILQEIPAAAALAEEEQEEESLLSRFLAKGTAALSRDEPKDHLPEEEADSPQPGSWSVEQWTKSFENKIRAEGVGGGRLIRTFLGGRVPAPPSEDDSLTVSPSDLKEQETSPSPSSQIIAQDAATSPHKPRAEGGGRRMKAFLAMGASSGDESALKDLEEDRPSSGWSAEQWTHYMDNRTELKSVPTLLFLSQLVLVSPKALIRRLSFHKIGDAGVAKLAEALVTNSSITKIRSVQEH